MYDICIMGAGASGMTAAITAARQNSELNIVVIERKEKAGKKIAATGNGHCNITNAQCPQVDKTIDFFRSIGVLLREDAEGRYYPYSGRAESVTKALKREMSALGVRLITHCCVLKIEPEEGDFKVTISDGKDEKQLCAKKVLIAAGGKAAPQYGTTGDGAKLACTLGHNIKKLSPSLTALECDGKFGLLKGVRAYGSVTLLKNGCEIAREQGEIQFTQYGISGICVFNLSRFVTLDDSRDRALDFRNYSVVLDLACEYSLEELTEIIWSNGRFLSATSSDLLNSITADAVAQFVMEKHGIQEGVFLADIVGITREKVAEIAHEVKNLTFTVTGAQGWKFAQCTRGGVALSDINVDTMESTVVPGIYFAGEVIDYDGPCGGFNLQHAWETGMRAGKAMAGSVK